jgi:hypothetical protein
MKTHSLGKFESRGYDHVGEVTEIRLLDGELLVIDHAHGNNPRPLKPGNTRKFKKPSIDVGVWALQGSNYEITFKHEKEM